MSDLIPPPFDVAVDCLDERHWVSVVSGEAVPRGHPATEEEQAVGALGGPLAPCLAAAEMVRDNPRALVVAEHYVSAPPGLTNVSLTAAQFEEARRVPSPLRRLARIALTRDEITRHSKPDAVLSRGIRNAVRDSDESVLEDVVISVGSRRSIEPTSRPGGGGPSVFVTVPARWLATVYLFGVAVSDERLVLGAALRPDGLELTRLTREPLGTEQVLVPLPDGIRAPTVEARA